MPFAFADKDLSVAKAVRKLARQRMEASLALLEQTERPRAEVIRELRKNIKKTRALLRLVRPGFKHYGRENDALRQASRLISDLRDGDALAEAFQRIEALTFLPARQSAELRAAVVQPQIALADAQIAERMDEHRSAIAAIAERIRGWKVDTDGFDALAPGLERTWVAAQKAMDTAQSNPTADALHDWRKRTKDHWYHARLLAPIWPEVMAQHVACADALGERLGEARDLAFLMRALSRVTGAEEFCQFAAGEEARLLADARFLGARFFDEPAVGLSRRWRGWWMVWRG